jgi:hypothetical protein
MIGTSSFFREALEAARDLRDLLHAVLRLLLLRMSWSSR